MSNSYSIPIAFKKQRGFLTKNATLILEFLPRTLRSQRVILINCSRHRSAFFFIYVLSLENSDIIIDLENLRNLKVAYVHI